MRPWYATRRRKKHSHSRPVLFSPAPNPPRTSSRRRIRTRAITVPAPLFPKLVYQIRTPPAVEAAGVAEAAASRALGAGADHISTTTTLIALVSHHQHRRRRLRRPVRRNSPPMSLRRFREAKPAIRGSRGSREARSRTRGRRRDKGLITIHWWSERYEEGRIKWFRK